MPIITLRMGSGSFPELTDDSIIVDNKEPWVVARLAGGMLNGDPALMLRLQLPDGRFAYAEMSQLGWCMAAKAFEARSEFERDNPGWEPEPDGHTH